MLLPKNPVKQHTLSIRLTMPQPRKLFSNRRCLFELYWRALSYFPYLTSFIGTENFKGKHQWKYQKSKTTFNNSKQLFQVVYINVSGELLIDRGKLWRQPTLHTWRENEIDVADWINKKLEMQIWKCMGITVVWLPWHWREWRRRESILSAQKIGGAAEVQRKRLFDWLYQSASTWLREHQHCTPY